MKINIKKVIGWTIFTVAVMCMTIFVLSLYSNIKTGNLLENGIVARSFNETNKEKIINALDIPNEEYIDVVEFEYQNSFRDPFAVVTISLPVENNDKFKFGFLENYKIISPEYSFSDFEFSHKATGKSPVCQYENFKKLDCVVFEFKSSTEYTYIFYKHRSSQDLLDIAQQLVKEKNYSVK